MTPTQVQLTDNDAKYFVLFETQGEANAAIAAVEQLRIDTAASNSEIDTIARENKINLARGVIQTIMNSVDLYESNVEKLVHNISRSRSLNFVDWKYGELRKIIREELAAAGVK